LSTLDADGRSHITAVGAFWVDDRYDCGKPRSRKIRSIERDARCSFGVAIHGYDIALEGRATRVTDDAQLQRIAQVFTEGGGRRRWPTEASPTTTVPRVPARLSGTSASSPPSTRTP
jgi:hypothetical protein